MPNQFFGHIEKWLLLSQSDTDFTTLFVRAWIPFNAWYVNNYHETRDRTCIDNLKGDNNQFRSRLIALLTTDDESAKEFKHYLARLQQRLELYPVPDANNPISLKSIYYRENPVTVTLPVVMKRGRMFKAEKHAGGSVDAVVIKQSDNSTLYSYNHNRYDFAHFESDLIHSTLSSSQKEVLKRCFIEINPRIKENLVLSKKRNALVVDSLCLINNPNLISKAVIELLYSLRNKLFHGELQPSRQNLSVYEPAYFILRILLKSLV